MHQFGCFDTKLEDCLLLDVCTDDDQVTARINECFYQQTRAEILYKDQVHHFREEFKDDSYQLDYDDRLVEPVPRHSDE